MYRNCRSDVDILQWRCLQFRDKFLLICDVDPFRDHTIVLCMDVRDSFYGGRVNATRLFYDAKDVEKVKKFQDGPHTVLHQRQNKDMFNDMLKRKECSRPLKTELNPGRRWT
ncbi:uncharacterized protein LOC111085616 [Limulus polyphemus]|uniref:Uncharacterized protein LOC111085616 n=1 Tax=Limulus polyphemus TaxID=6850 RepID=A0ABM1SAX0_LIMPO|nr:uncharacterized protein LOC111085616 [Limulus polyphemus]